VWFSSQIISCTSRPQNASFQAPRRTSRRAAVAGLDDPLPRQLGGIGGRRAHVLDAKRRIARDDLVGAEPGGEVVEHDRDRIRVPRPAPQIGPILLQAEAIEQREPAQLGLVRPQDAQHPLALGERRGGEGRGLGGHGGG
jgi:hypothetical protein